MEPNSSAEHDGVAAALAAAAAAAAAASNSASWEHVQTDYDRDLQRLEKEMIARHMAQSANLSQSQSAWLEEGSHGGGHDHHYTQQHHGYNGDYGHEANEYQRRPSALERGFDVDLSDRITMGLMDSSELRPLPAHLNLQRLRLESQQRAAAGSAGQQTSGTGGGSDGMPQPGHTTLDRRGFDVNLTDRVFMGLMMDSTELRPLPPGVRTASLTASASSASGAAGGGAAGGGGRPGGAGAAAVSLSRDDSDGGTAADGSVSSDGQKRLLERANSNGSSSGRGLWGMGGKSQRTAAAAAESSSNSSSSNSSTAGKSPHQRAKSRLGLSPSFRGGSGGGGGGGASGATTEMAETLATPPEQPGNDSADAESELDSQRIANDPLANTIMAGPLESLPGLKSIMLDPSQLRLRRLFLEGQGGRVFRAEYKGSSVLVHLVQRGDYSSAERDAESGASMVRDVQRTHTIPPHTNLSGVCAAACVRVRRQQQQQDAPAHGGDPPMATWCTVTEFTGLGLTLREALDRMNGSSGATTSSNSSSGSGSGGSNASSSVAASRKGGGVPFATAASLALAVAQGMAHLHATFGPHPSGLSSHTIAPSPPGNSAADGASRGTGSGGCIIGGSAKVIGLLTEATIRDAPGHTSETGGYRWMAPECIHSKGPRHPKSDVFSFGIVLWELVTGEVPYGAMTTPMQVAFSVVQKKQRPEIPDKCPPSLGRLMEDCWHNDPEARPSFSEIVPRLESAKISVAISGSGRRRGILGCFSSPPTQD